MKLLNVRNVVWVVAALGAMASREAAAERIEIPVPGLQFTGKGHYVSKPDRRDLAQIVHPWTASKAGDFGQLEARVRIPSGARPPFTLVFYVMDNNYTGPTNTGADWINRDVRTGHRFRQALIDGQVVWQQDTALDDASRHYLVDLGDRVKPGTTVRVAFRLWDAVDSSVTLPGDVYITEHYATKVATAVRHVVKDRHETRSFWGDAAIYTGSKPKAEEIPWGGQVVLRWPAAGPAQPTAREGKMSVRLEKAELLNGPWSWPVSQGIPFSAGLVAAPSQAAILAPDGRPVAAEITKLNAWPDGSVAWSLACFTLPAGAAGPFELRYGGNAPAAAQPRNPVVARDDFAMHNGLVGVSWPDRPPGSPLVILRGADERIAAGPVAYLRAAGKQFSAKWSGRTWIRRSSQVAEMQATGDLVSDDGQRYGGCRLQVAVFAGCPYVRLRYRIVNERPEKTFSAQAYGLKLPTEAGKPQASGPGWASVQTKGGCLTAVVRWFTRLWPNGIEAGADGIDFQCFKPGDPRLPAYQTHPGEAKTQEIWLAVTPTAPSQDDCRRLAALVETPPRLDASAAIRESRVWGCLPRITAAEHGDVYAKIEQALSPYFANCKENVRLFGEYTTWDNFYWNTLHTMYSLYAMTGERKWFDWAERSVRHHFDVDICHWQPAQGAVGVVGGIHGYWGDHSDTPCYSLIQNADGAFDHWNLTGDPDGYRYGVGIAEYVRTSPNIGRGASTREQGWPVLCMLAAWRQTGEAKYGDHARLLVETALPLMERRRGTYIEVHGSVSYLGPTPFMYGILCTALREYHLKTGDDRAATLLARLANAVYEESHDPWRSKTLPNLDYYYSPNPYLRGGDGFTPITQLNLNIASAQAYGAYVTQDAGLADIARRTWLAGLHGGSVYAEMAYDLAGVVWWLDRTAGPGKK